MFDLVGRAKWDAWNQLGTMEKVSIHVVHYTNMYMYMYAYNVHLLHMCILCAFLHVVQHTVFILTSTNSLHYIYARNSSSHFSMSCCLHIIIVYCTL